MRFIMAASSMSPAVPVPPAKISLPLCSAGTEKHSASSAPNQSNYPKKCAAEPVRGEQNEAQRLLAITSLQSLLVISLLLWKKTRTAWKGAMCSRQTEKRPHVTPVPKKYQLSLRSLAVKRLLWGLAAICSRILARCSV